MCSDMDCENRVGDDHVTKEHSYPLLSWSYLLRWRCTIILESPLPICPLCTTFFLYYMGLLHFSKEKHLVLGYTESYLLLLLVFIGPFGWCFGDHVVLGTEVLAYKT